MPEGAQALFAEWKLPVWLTAAIVATAVLYLRGWMALRKTRPQYFEAWRAGAFLGGLSVLWLAIASPLDEFADVLLSAHMVEHLLIMSVCPPLLLLAAPVVPLLRGVPAGVRRVTLGPLLRVTALRKLGRWLVQPAVAWVAMNLIFLGWHVPGAYDFALEHEGWHDFEHLCFLGTSLLFWWCVLLPWPARGRRYSWSILLFLIAADLVNTMLSAFLAFCGRPVYTFYLQRANPFGMDAMSDQVLGAVIMWVFGSLVFLVPAVAITVRLLETGSGRGPRH